MVLLILHVHCTLLPCGSLYGSAPAEGGQGDEVHGAHDVHVNGLRRRLNVPEKKLSPSWRRSILNFHQEKMLLLLYLLYFLLQATSQGTFLLILLFQQCPLVRHGSTHCSTSSCPGPYRCLTRASMEKKMSIYLLATLSASIVILGTSFFAYGIYHYLLKDRATSRVQSS